MVARGAKPWSGGPFTDTQQLVIKALRKYRKDIRDEEWMQTRRDIYGKD